MRVGRYRTTLIFVAVLLTTLLAYLPGMWGPFVFDDHPNLLANPMIYLSALDLSSLRDAALSNQSGLFGRPIASLSFALNYHLAGGFVPFHFKLTNLLIHSVNGILVFFLSQQIYRCLRGTSLSDVSSTSPSLLPLVVSALWLLHPIQLTSVLYVVQRMNSMAAMFTLAGLLIFMQGRVRLDRGEPLGFWLMLIGVIGGSGLGLLCKENAALLPVYALVLELSCFKSSALNRWPRLQVRIFFATVLALPALVAVTYILLNPEFVLSAYQSRTFSLEERVLTQARVLFFYVGLVLFPSRSALGLFHDDFLKSTGLLQPATTLISLLAWTLLVACAVALRRRAPFIFLGIAWFLGGHLMESSILALELVHEHRNYLPIFGILFSFSYAILLLLERIKAHERVTTTSAVLIILVLGFVTSSRAYSWSSTGVLLETLIKHHPEAARTHSYYAVVLINTRGDIHKAFYHLQQYSRLKPDAVFGLAEMIGIAKAVGLVDDPSKTKPSVTAGISSVFEIPLVNHPEQLEKIVREANAELERRLMVYPISGNTVKTFVDLQRCLYEGRQVCVAMFPDLIRWMELALDNSRTSPTARAVLLMTTAKTYSWGGEVEKAVEYAERAVETLPGDANLAIELARLHLELENYERGLEVVDLIKRRGSAFGFRAGQIRELEARLRAGAQSG